jgi:hypothetical protein
MWRQRLAIQHVYHSMRHIATNFQANRLRAARPMAALSITAALALLACSAPAGLMGAQLAAEPVLAATMPGATEVVARQRDPSSSLSGRQPGFAWRIFGAEVEAAEALAWHRATFEAAGWAPTDDSPLAHHDGRSPQQTWRQGDLVLGFGVLDRENLNLLPAQMETLEAFPTTYEVSLVYGPARPSPTK